MLLLFFSYTNSAKLRIESSVGKGTRVLLDLTHFEGRIE